MAKSAAEKVFPAHDVEEGQVDMSTLTVLMGLPLIADPFAVNW